MFSYNLINEEQTLPTPRILIVEDEARLSGHLQELLNGESFSTFACPSLPELRNILELPGQRFDLIVLDRLLGSEDSASIVKMLKNKMPELKILVLSAINTGAEKAALLDMGADDYVAKPFSGEELVARIRALLRRGIKEISLGDLVLDLEQRTLVIAAQSNDLTNKEFALLKTLMSNPGKVFSKSLLYNRVWGVSTDVESNVVETTINKLRKRFKEGGTKVQIRNLRNSGYWIEE